jgi:voltage-gated potassium channel
MTNIRKDLYEIIFESDTRAGKMFDVVLIVFILISVLAVILDSVKQISVKYHDLLVWVEWIITISFSLEYLVRIWTSPKPIRYILSFFGLIDFLAIIPTYLSVIFGGAMGFAVIRGLRLLRIFRILKITRYSNEGKIIVEALQASRVKIIVFLFAVLTTVLIIGTLMYLIEGEENGFTSIPVSVYWTIVTLTTVGYGDITPLTAFGKFIAGFVMILGYGIIAVPTSILTYELTTSVRTARKKTVCSKCGSTDHDKDAKFCKVCGQEL